MKEIWNDIVNYEGLYQVSNMGKVKSLNRTDSTGREIKGVMLKPHSNGRGYLYITLCKDGKRNNAYIHRLVAMSFINNYLSYNEINHINENKGDNEANNLEWCTRKYNMNYGNGIALRKSNTNYKDIADKNSKRVYQLDMNKNIINTFKSAREVERLLGYGNSLISMCCTGKNKSGYGYMWTHSV